MRRLWQAKLVPPLRKPVNRALPERGNGAVEQRQQLRHVARAERLADARLFFGHRREQRPHRYLALRGQAQVVAPPVSVRAVARGQAAAPVVKAAVDVDASRIRQKPEAPFKEAKQAVDLSQAARIVAVGRGIKSQEHLKVAEQLAQALGAEIAASRPICDAGWLPMDRQIGSSGQTVAPKLYVALGISGAIQHLVGMKGARTIVAINKDADAPIFEVADYGIVGDLFEVVPALVTELEKG